MRLYNGVQILPGVCPANVRRLDLGAVPMIVSMHQQGTLIDQKHFKWLQGELETRLTGIDANIRTRVGGWKPRGLETFNIGSPVQVGELLYDHIAIHRARPNAVKKTDSGRLSTGDEFLSLFKDVDPLVQMVLDWRQTKKLLTTYAYKIPAMARSQGGRIHTEFLLTRTSTGRIASKAINLQNIPVRSDWGKEIRKGFVAQDGWVLVSLDLSQIEMVLAAFMSGDPTMMDVFLNGLDIHNKTACSIFRIDEQYITQLALEADLDEKKLAVMDPIRKAEWKKFKNGVRLPCKTLGFGILYGQTPEGLQTGIAAAGGPWWELDKCEKLVADWYNVYSGVADWMQEQHQRARRYGMVWDLFGRARLIPEVRSVHRANVNAGLRACGNMPIQATAGGILKLAMAYIHREVLPLYAGVARALLTIHDELIFECRADVAAEFVEVGKTVMETVVPLLAGFGGPTDVPIKSSGDTAISWGALK